MWPIDFFLSKPKLRHAQRKIREIVTNMRRRGQLNEQVLLLAGPSPTFQQWC